MKIETTAGADRTSSHLQGFRFYLVIFAMALTFAFIPKTVNACNGTDSKERIKIDAFYPLKVKFKFSASKKK